MQTPVVSLPVPAVVGIGHQRLQRARHRQALADRRVDVVEEVGGRIGRVEVDGLGGVDRRAAADGDERVVGRLPRERDRIAESTRRSARCARDRRARTRGRCLRAIRAAPGPASAAAERRIGDDEHAARRRDRRDPCRLHASRRRRSAPTRRSSRTRFRWPPAATLLRPAAAPVPPFSRQSVSSSRSQLT